MVEQKDYVSYSVLINGIEVNAVYSRDSIDGIFRPLLRRLTRMHRSGKEHAPQLFGETG